MVNSDPSQILASYGQWTHSMQRTTLTSDNNLIPDHYTKDLVPTDMYAKVVYVHVRPTSK